VDDTTLTRADPGGAKALGDPKSARAEASDNRRVAPIWSPLVAAKHRDVAASAEHVMERLVVINVQT